MNFIRALMLVSAAVVAAPQASADPFPTRPIKILVAFGPGSGGDLLARTVGQKLQVELAVSVVIENKVGALGQIATLALAKAPPDGYTLGMGSSSTHSTAPYLTRNLPYDPIKDFSAVAGLNSYTFALLVPASSPATTPQQLVELVRRRGSGFYGFGNASGRVGAAHFRRLAKLDVTEVAYKSSPDALTDLAAGRVDFLFTDWGSAKAFVDSGRLRAIGVMADRRSAVLPELPAVGEFYPGFDFDNWGGLMAPANTPPQVLSRLNSAVTKVLALPEVHDRLSAMGMEVKPASPAELARLVAAQQRAWSAAIQAAGIPAE